MRSAAEAEAAACWAGAVIGCCCIHCGAAAVAWSMLWHGGTAGGQRGGPVGAGCVGDGASIGAGCCGG
eukprot:14206477-Alexandrium_andersonii.AAC.1